jgi:hypothetical protein
MTTTQIPGDYLVERQGKTLIMVKWLELEAHRRGFKKIAATLIQAPSPENQMICICQGEVIREDDHVFIDIGDASPENVNRNIAPHFVRMAATRAKGRALRMALGIDMGTVEELHDDDDKPRAADKRTGEIRSNGTQQQQRTPTAERLASMPSPGINDLGKPKLGDRIIPKDDSLWTDKTTGIIARADRAVNLGVDIKAVLAELGITKWAGGLTLTQCDELRGRLGIEIASREPAPATDSITAIREAAGVTA